MDATLRKSRADAKRKFTRKVTLLKEAYARKDPIQVLKDIYSDVCEQFVQVEEINEKLMDSLDTKSEDYDSVINSHESYIVEVESTKNVVHAMIVKAGNDGKPGVADLSKTRMQRLSPPHFDGKIREYSTFCKDYDRLMKSVYGDDPYALRSCLSGEALEIVRGADDSFTSMIDRLNARYGNPSKQVEIVLGDIKSLRVVPEGNPSKFIEMVNMVERAYLDLDRLGLSSEMNTVTMVSQVEKLLPSVQKREWVKILQTIKDKDELFAKLLDYLLKEKQALEYMHADVRVTGNTNRAQVHAANMDSETSELTAALTTLQGKQDKMEESLNKLTKQISTVVENVHKTRAEPLYLTNCWLHGTDTHDITRCTGFQRLSSDERVDAVRNAGACFLCLQLGHRGRQCTTGAPCSECGKYHHRMLHSFFSKPPPNINSNLLSRDGVLLMINSVYSHTRPVTTLWDPGSNMTLITNRMAKHLGLKGRSINLTVTKVGNECTKMETREYDVPLSDCYGEVRVLKACGIAEITSETYPVDTRSVATLLGVQDKDIERPHGKIDLLIGSDYCELLPSVVRTVGSLQLMRGPFGYCIRGSHPLLKVGFVDNTNVCVRISHMTSVSNVNDLSVEPKASLTKRLEAYSDQIQDMVSRGVARKLTKEEIKNYKGPVHYLPHHEVLKPESKSTPIRIVFNSSASYMGHILNEYYAKGPDVLRDLWVFY
ncbi:uncharacterized protein LOC123508205 [Portunus trituberculatus]|uniref:uncharacterized protein LOC123508205 n=1 Tax=Portunus trituberculatus TaxID=210409 RepID=UPI001E1CFF9A|nr:uncharacterized protein LOC123508205 [Portunus trituberculatus]